MKRWLVHVTIGVYLAALAWGVLAHTLRISTGRHPVMYFLVWDMFCGWSAWTGQTHIVGEGESGRFYELAPAPWGELHPFGSLDRKDYDPNSIYSARMAVNCIRRTQHEPIVRIFVIEENWPKKYNLPDHLYARLSDRPRDVQKYYRLRHVLTGDGQLLQTYAGWLTYQAGVCLADNPRLRAETRKSSPFYGFGTVQQLDNPYSAGSHFAPVIAPPTVAAPQVRVSGN